MGGDVGGASCSERALCEATRAIAWEGLPEAETEGGQQRGAQEAAEGGAHAQGGAEVDEEGGAQGVAQGRAVGDERGGAEVKGRPPRILTKAILEVTPVQCSDHAISLLGGKSDFYKSPTTLPSRAQPNENCSQGGLQILSK